MKTTIILAHPWHGSFNKAIMDKVQEKLETRKKPYQVIDLNKDDFNPTLTERDLSLFSRGESSDEKVGGYQDMLMQSDEVIIIFPVWWYDTPAILKGFFDKIMLKNFAYKETKSGLKGLLTHIKKTTVITTSEYPTWYLFLLGNPIKRLFINLTLKGIGLKRVKWLNNGSTSTGKAKDRKKFLSKVLLAV